MHFAGIATRMKHSNRNSEDAFDALDRGDGKMITFSSVKNVFNGKSRSLEYGKFGECEDCYDEK